MDYIVEHHGCSRRRACRLVRQHRSTQYYRSVKDRREDLRARMREITRVAACATATAGSTCC